MNLKLLEYLHELDKKHPDQRLGQLLFNYTRFGTRPVVGLGINDIFHYEDEAIIEDIEKELSQQESTRAENS